MDCNWDTSTSLRDDLIKKAKYPFRHEWASANINVCSVCLHLFALLAMYIKMNMHFFLLCSFGWSWWYSEFIVCIFRSDSSRTTIISLIAHHQKWGIFISMARNYATHSHRDTFTFSFLYRRWANGNHASRTPYSPFGKTKRRTSLLMHNSKCLSCMLIENYGYH